MLAYERRKNASAAVYAAKCTRLDRLGRQLNAEMQIQQILQAAMDVIQRGCRMMSSLGTLYFATDQLDFLVFF